MSVDIAALQDANISNLSDERWKRLMAQHAADGQPTSTFDPGRFVSGGSFLFDQPDGVPAIWGRGEDVLWSQGESLWLVGNPGVGKTTMTGQLVRGRLGLADFAIAWPVAAGERKVLYLAMDRPRQIARALRRHFTADERDVLDEKLIIWKGPPPVDVATNTGLLAEMCRHADADTLIVDSAKDAAIKLTDDEVGAAFNRALQKVTVEGVEVVALHHQRKGAAGDKNDKLSDVYGSTWLTAGAGSVILLNGQAGDLTVELLHLKQPAADVGPLKITHDHSRGVSTIEEQWDPLQWLRGRGEHGGTAMDAARAMFYKSKPTDNERRKTQRRLDRLVDAGHATRTEPRRGGAGGAQAALYRASLTSEGMAP